MELTYDWVNFQGMFYPHRKSMSVQHIPTGPIFLVLDGDSIVSAFADHEDLTRWVGGSYQDMLAKVPDREITAFDREAVDKCLQDSMNLPNFYEQAEFFRGQVKPRADSRHIDAKNFALAGRRHFLLDGMQGWWSKVLPSSYGLYIKVEGGDNQEFMVIVRRGNFAGFQEPDLSTLNPERRRNPSDVIKYLSEKYMVPVQGIFVPASDWAEWSRHSSPWREVTRAIKANRVKLVPFRWGLASLMASRAFLKI